MSNRSIPPALDKAAFNCPFCGVLTTQRWYEVYVDRIESDAKIPRFPNEGMENDVRSNKDLDSQTKQTLLGLISKLRSGAAFVRVLESGQYLRGRGENIFLSECYHCHEVAVWVYQRLVYPGPRTGPEPNADLPHAVRQDYEEARTILNESPRGAAALLRLCVQKLCAHLGEKGKNIDDDIASLVSKGLNPLVQQSLDIVRVIGNEAVHPGVLDLRDDRTTALRLLDIINLIGAQMISQPKMVQSMYDTLPEQKRRAIDLRNQRASSGGTSDA